MIAISVRKPSMSSAVSNRLLAILRLFGFGFIAAIACPLAVNAQDFRSAPLLTLAEDIPSPSDNEAARTAMITGSGTWSNPQTPAVPSVAPVVTGGQNFGPSAGVPSGAEMWYELAELRRLAQRQEQELVALQLATRTPAEASVGHWFANYESVIVQPLQSNGSGLIVETDSGYSHVAFPWQLSYSPRIEVGREVTGGPLGWRLRFWELKKDQSFTANAATGLIPAGKEGTVGYLSEDGDITTGLAFIEDGTFFSHIRTDVIDLEIQRQLSDPIDLYAGLRYAKLLQGYRAVTDQGNAAASSEFRGIGPTVALRIRHSLPLKRISFFSNLRGSLLFGHKDFSVIDDVNNIQQAVGALDVRSFKDGIDTLAANAEIQLGLRLVPLDWLGVTVALEGQHYTNVGGPNPTAVFIGPDSGLAGDSPMDDSLSFVGLNVGTEVIW